MTVRRPYSATQVSVAVLAVLPILIQQWLPRGEQRGDIYVALNPRRKDRNLGSFQINTLTGHWDDHAVPIGGGNPVSLYAYLFSGDDRRAAFKKLADDPHVRAALVDGRAAPPAKVAVPLKSPAKLAQVRKLHDKAVPVHGMPAAAYLHGRGLRPTDAWDRLRVLMLPYRGQGRHPVLIAPIEALDGSLVGLHRTYLTPAGAKLDVPEPRLTLGYPRGGAIRLGKVTADHLIICEGLEDGLTIYQELTKPIPVWVAGGASFLHLMGIPDEVRCLTIAADNDAPGERAARRAADKLGVGGREVRIWRPKPGFKDMNDQLRNIRSKD